MYVCLCAGVTDKQIEQAVHGGARSLEALVVQLGVGTACGRCRDAVDCIAARAAAGGSWSIDDLRRCAAAP